MFNQLYKPGFCVLHTPPTHTVLDSSFEPLRESFSLVLCQFTQNLQKIFRETTLATLWTNIVWRENK